MNKHLTDALNATVALATFVEGRDRSSLDDDLMFRSAVERQFEILGEALVRVRDEDPLTAGAIPDLRQIVGLRNVIAHRYDSLDLDVLWETMQNDAPVLRRVLLQLLT